MTVQIYTLDLLLSLSCCKMCLIEFSVDDALVFSVFRSEDSLGIDLQFALLTFASLRRFRP